MIFKELSSGIDSDVIVIAVLVENIRRITARYRPFINSKGEEQWLAKPYYTLNLNKLILHHVPVPKRPLKKEDLALEDVVDPGGRFPWVRRCVNKFGPRFKGIVQSFTNYDPVPEYKYDNHPSWRLMSAILENWISSTDTPVILMPIPLYQHVEENASPKHYQARFREVAAETGAILHDPLIDLASYSKEDRRNFRFNKDIHPTPQYHMALADSLAPVLRSVIYP